jgi:hypothetical protein
MACCFLLAIREPSSMFPIRKSHHHVLLHWLIVSRTMFQSDAWPFDDKSDPMAGWNIIEVHKIPWAASHDTYGKLFAYLRKEFQAFLQRIATLKIHIQLFNVDAKLLPELLTPKSYGRIEVDILLTAFTLSINKTHRSRTYQMRATWALVKCCHCTDHSFSPERRILTQPS